VRRREALERNRIARVPFLPVWVLHHDGAPVGGWAISNVFAVVPALDLARSDYALIGDEQPARRAAIAVQRRGAPEATTSSG
jgi:hypothetical protein